MVTLQIQVFVRYGDKGQGLNFQESASHTYTLRLC